jgi:2-dehydro-3-deoxyphosphogluconate aldolase/(4S)-4-hydroxy-2-oxoglutarate aldolase
VDYLSRIPIIGIMRGAATEAVETAAEAAVRGGLRILEITLNRPEAFDQIASLSSRFGDEIDLGAGTVLDADAAATALSAGAQFIVTPALLPEVVEFCRSRAVPVFPGAFSPTEIFSAHRAGAEMVKIFPAASLGPDYIKSLKGPFPDIRLMPTGGVSAASAPDYFAAGAAAIGAGGELFRNDWLKSGNWSAIEEAARAYVQAAQDSI